MPSGITSDIYNGKDVTLRDFLMTVGRQMSMAIMQRDDDPGESVKLREPSKYERDGLTKAQQKSEKYALMTLQEAAREASAEYRRLFREHKEAAHKNAELETRYDAMIEKVEGWKPDPIVQYVKDHALKYLRESREFDCGFIYPPEPDPADYAPEKWLTRKRAEAAANLARRAEEWQEEVARVADFNRHIEAFHRSLPDA